MDCSMEKHHQINHHLRDFERIVLQFFQAFSQQIQVHALGIQSYSQMLGMLNHLKRIIFGFLGLTIPRS